MSLYAQSVVPMRKMLGNLDKWIEAGKRHAEKRGFDTTVLFHARLAPDQFPFARQVQAACDAAKAAAARITGREPPSHPDTEQTLDELCARVRTCCAYLDSFTPNDFEGAETRLLALPFLDGKVILAQDYLTEMALPNFYFHITTSYAILRHNGVELGKRDFIGGLSVRDP